MLIMKMINFWFRRNLNQNVEKRQMKKMMTNRSKIFHQNIKNYSSSHRSKCISSSFYLNENFRKKSFKHSATNCLRNIHLSFQLWQNSQFIRKMFESNQIKKISMFVNTKVNRSISMRIRKYIQILSKFDQNEIKSSIVNNKMMHDQKMKISIDIIIETKFSVAVMFETKFSLSSRSKAKNSINFVNNFFFANLCFEFFAFDQLQFWLYISIENVFSRLNAAIIFFNVTNIIEFEHSKLVNDNFLTFRWIATFVKLIVNAKMTKNWNLHFKKWKEKFMNDIDSIFLNKCFINANINYIMNTFFRIAEKFCYENDSFTKKIWNFFFEKLTFLKSCSFGAKFCQYFILLYIRIINEKNLSHQISIHIRCEINFWYHEIWKHIYFCDFSKTFDSLIEYIQRISNSYNKKIILIAILKIVLTKKNSVMIFEIMKIMNCQSKTLSCLKKCDEQHIANLCYIRTKFANLMFFSIFSIMKFGSISSIIEFSWADMSIDIRRKKCLSCHVCHIKTERFSWSRFFQRSRFHQICFIRSRECKSMMKYLSMLTFTWKISFRFEKHTITITTKSKF